MALSRAMYHVALAHRKKKEGGWIGGQSGEEAAVRGGCILVEA